MNIPSNVRMLARAADQVREDYRAGRITFDQYDDASTSFSDALEAWKDEVAPVDDEDYNEPFEPGDICTTEDDGLIICTDNGNWTITRDMGLRLIRGLSSLMIRTDEQES